jgi:crossover junction endodeoxyribonuclease RuvC
MTARHCILGIDPGSHATGWGVIQALPTLQYLASGVIRPGRDLGLPARLFRIHEDLVAVIAQHAPQVMAVEDLFNARNARSALVLGHARGAVLLAGARCGLTIQEYAPAVVKQALTGNGRAGKEQVRFMVQRLLRLQASPALDESDALAVALAHQGRGRLPALPAGRGRR